MERVQCKKYKSNVKTMRKDFLYFVFNNGEISNTFYVLEIISTRSKDADMGNVRRNVYILLLQRE